MFNFLKPKEIFT